MRRAIQLVAVLSFAAASGVWLGCGNVIKDPARSFCETNDCCQTNQDCVALKTAAGDTDPSSWICLVQAQQCVPYDPVCRNDSVCCPGQRCAMITEEEGVCGDVFTSCDPEDPSTCQVKGQYCESNFGSRDTREPGCTFHSCASTADCAERLQCFNGSCVGEIPCEGCPNGGVCTPATNRCYQVGGELPSSCRVTCPEGQLLVFTDPTNLFGLCDMNSRECACLPLPTFPAGE